MSGVLKGGPEVVRNVWAVPSQALELCVSGTPSEGYCLAEGMQSTTVQCTVSGVCDVSNLQHVEATHVHLLLQQGFGRQLGV